MSSQPQIYGKIIFSLQSSGNWIDEINLLLDFLWGGPRCNFSVAAEDGVHAESPSAKAALMKVYLLIMDTLAMTRWSLITSISPSLYWLWSQCSGESPLLICFDSSVSSPRSSTNWPILCRQAWLLCLILQSHIYSLEGKNKLKEGVSLPSYCCCCFFFYTDIILMKPFLYWMLINSEKKSLFSHKCDDIALIGQAVM